MKKKNTKDLFQRSASYWLNRADLQRQAGDLLRAVVMERHAFGVEPTNVEVATRYVLTLRELGCYSASNREAFSALARNPQNLDLLGLIGLNFHSMGMHQAAQDALNNYLGQPMPDDQALPEWHDEAYNCAMRYEQQKKPQREKRIDGLLNIAFIRLAKEDWENVRRALDRAEKLPGSPARREFAEALWQLHEANLPEMNMHLMQAITLEPRNARQLSACADLFKMTGENKLAHVALCRALDFARTPEEISAALGASDTLEAPHLAIGMLRRLVKHQPNNAALLYDLSLCLLRLGKIKDAERHLRLCRELDPDDAHSQILFQQLQLLKDLVPTPAKAMRLGNDFPWHGDFNDQIITPCLMAVMTALQSGVKALAEDPGMRSQLFTLMQMEADWPSELLMTVSSAMDDEDREAFLREVLLQCPNAEKLRRTAIAMLDEMHAQPPYASWKKGRLVWINPNETPAKEASFRQRHLTRRLRMAHKLCENDAYFIPWAMETITKLGRDVQSQIIADPAHVWPAALAIRYRALRGMAPIHLHSINRDRAALLNHALRCLR